MPNYRPEPERFWEKVARGNPDDCWEWQAAIATTGYGQFGRTGRIQVGAHRWSYEAHYGPIAEGMFIDHICRNRACVNPNHLRAVTPRENCENHSGPIKTNKSGLSRRLLRDGNTEMGSSVPVQAQSPQESNEAVRSHRGCRRCCGATPEHDDDPQRLGPPAVAGDNHPTSAGSSSHSVAAVQAVDYPLVWTGDQA